MEASLIRRYSYKLGVNLIGMPASFVIQWLAIRALGPVGYGSFTYISGIFTEIFNFFDAGTSTGFYVKLCARPDENGLTVFYWRFAFFVGLLVLIITGLLLALGLDDLLRFEQTTLSVILAALCALGIWMMNIGVKIVDAYGLTKEGEIARLAQRILSVVALTLMFYLGWLNVETFFAAQILLAALQLWLWQYQLDRHGRSFWGYGGLDVASTKRYNREFWEYSHPLLAMALASMMAGIADRWLLQRFAGTIEQGFFGISQQVGAFCFVFTSAMVPLFARELSQAHQTKDLTRMARDFARHLPLFYTLSAFVGVFTATQSTWIALVLGGKAFAESEMVILIMCFYPIHQTYGQLNISVFYATNQTRLYRNIGLLFIAIGIGVTYLLLAPRIMYGLDLGAIGLALKLVLMQAIVVNIQLFYNTRRLGLSYYKFLVHQVLVLVLLATMGFGLKLVVNNFGLNATQSVLICGVLYTFLVGVIIWSWPVLIARSRQELRSLFRTGLLAADVNRPPSL